MTTQTQCIAAFEIRRLEFLDQNGVLTQPLPPFAASLDNLIPLYEMMVRTRVFDAKAIALQRTGKMGTYPSTLGQEAISVAIGSAMQKDDVLCPYYREYGAQLWRGVRMEEVFMYWGGDERGSDFKNCRNDFPICVPIASQVLHAVGVALAFKLRHEKKVVVTALGDGATSKGDFYEAINFAGVQKLPVVFVINNNKWAISVPLSLQTATQTLAQKAIAGAVDAIQVDGNDLIAMKYALDEAILRARTNNEPCVIEATTYRMCDHTTADDARRYRPDEELQLHKAQDPILRLRQFLFENGKWNPDKEKELLNRCQEEVQQAAERYLNIDARPPESMFDHLYETLPKAYATQREDVKRFGGKHG